MVETVVGLAATPNDAILRSTKTTAYASGQIVAQSATAGNCKAGTVQVARQNGGSGMVRRIGLKFKGDATFLNAVMRVHFLTLPPAFTNGDAGAWLGGVSDTGYIGSCDVTLDQQFSDGSVKGIGVPNAGSEINFVCDVNFNALSFVVECRSTTAGAHSATGTTFIIVTDETLRN